MESENQEIKCTTLCDAQRIIERAATKLKEAQSSEERQYYVKDILSEVETLLSCPNYNSKNPDCLSCYAVAYRYIQQYAAGASLAKNKEQR